MLGAMTGYTTREVAEALGLSPEEVRSFARAGLLAPTRGRGNEYRFSFQDIVLLRAAKGLKERALSSRKIRRALHRLREQLPEGRPLSAVHVAAAGEHVVVQDRGTVWEPETGQVTFDFSVGELASRVAPFAGRMAKRGEAVVVDADGWYELGWDLEAVSVPEAKEAYRRAIGLRPDHAEARVNLGRLLHEEGDVEGAEVEYRRALEVSPGSALARFNLGVALEDQGRWEEAASAYREAVELDATLSSAHFNLARLCEKSGDARGALRHLAAYRRLTGARGA